MLEILSKSEVSSESFVKNSLSHSFQCVELKPDEFDDFVSALAKVVPDHYIAPDSVADILERLGKKAAAQKLIDKIPEVKKIRSSDIGEIVTTDFIEESTDFFVPIRKLRWRDHRNIAMRGDDVIGVCINHTDYTYPHCQDHRLTKISNSTLAILDYGTISIKPLANAVSICALHPYGTSGMNENMPLRKNFREGLKKETGTE